MLLFVARSTQVSSLVGLFMMMMTMISAASRGLGRVVGVV